MISENELESIRDAQGLYLPSLLIIRRKRYQGDDKFEFENVAVDVPGRLMPVTGGRWMEVAQRFQGITPFVCTVAHDQDLQDGDVVVDEEAHTFEVRVVMDDSSYQTAKQALVDRMTDG